MASQPLERPVALLSGTAVGSGGGWPAAGPGAGERLWEEWARGGAGTGAEEALTEWPSVHSVGARLVCRVWGQRWWETIETED